MSIGLILGFFDGVHKAHRAVIESANKYSSESILITFKESPSVYFTGKAEYILSRKDSIEKMKHAGVKQIIELEFSKIAKITAEEYLDYLITTYHPASISTGYNHTFGVNKTGSPDILELNSKKYGYKYICTPPIKDNNEIISSSLIKNYLRSGNIERANFLLESNFCIEGKVIHGAEIGRKIGFPTANLNYPENIVKLPFGVYCTKLKIDGKEKRAIMNWGLKPTLNNVQKPIVEVNILDYSGDLYGENLKIEIIKHIRGEEKFPSLDELKKQIKKDIEVCLTL